MMKLPRQQSVFFFDFDNTVTQGDVLDRIIERFSVSHDWRRWEDAWVRGEISTLQCLDRQIAGLRATEPELLDFVGACQIDPYFAYIAKWAARERIGLFIVSDNFSCLVREILSRHGLAGLPVMANELTFSRNRPQAHFPFRSEACDRCAHCKALHFRRFEGYRKIYIGDGLSDICPALAADIIFAKDSLADYLANRGVAFANFASLEVVADFAIANCQPTESSDRTRRANARVRTQSFDVPFLREG